MGYLFPLLIWWTKHSLLPTVHGRHACLWVLVYSAVQLKFTEVNQLHAF